MENLKKYILDEIKNSPLKTTIAVAGATIALLLFIVNNVVPIMSDHQNSIEEDKNPVGSAAIAKQDHPPIIIEANPNKLQQEEINNGLESGGISRNSRITVGPKGSNFTSIQEAIDSANNGDTIIVSKGTYNEHIVVDKSLIIRGSGANSTVVDGQGISGSVFTLGKNNPFADVFLSNISITGGSGSLDQDEEITLGGGIANWCALTMKDCIVNGNFADYGGGIKNFREMTVAGGMIIGNLANVDAGGISNDGTMTIAYCLILQNHAENSDGGGINNNARMTIINSNISRNIARWAGGIDNSINGILTIRGSTIVDNVVANYGGGICNSDGKVQLAYCLISGNLAAQSGGGVWNRGNLLVSDSIISDNIAGQEGGGGIYNEGTKTLTNCTVINNSPDNIIG